MAVLKSVLYLLVMIVFVIVGLLFSFRNNSLIYVDLLFLQTESLSVGFWMLLSLVFGVVLGVLLVLPNSLLNKYKLNRLSKKLASKDLQVHGAKIESAKSV